MDSLPLDVLGIIFSRFVVDYQTPARALVRYREVSRGFRDGFDHPGWWFQLFGIPNSRKLYLSYRLQVNLNPEDMSRQSLNARVKNWRFLSFYEGQFYMEQLGGHMGSFLYNIIFTAPSIELLDQLLARYSKPDYPNLLIIARSKEIYDHVMEISNRSLNSYCQLINQVLYYDLPPSTLLSTPVRNSQLWANLIEADRPELLPLLLTIPIPSENSMVRSVIQFINAVDDSNFSTRGPMMKVLILIHALANNCPKLVDALTVEPWDPTQTGWICLIRFGETRLIPLSSWIPKLTRDPPGSWTPYIWNLVTSQIAYKGLLVGGPINKINLLNFFKALQPLMSKSSQQTLIKSEPMGSDLTLVIEWVNGPLKVVNMGDCRIKIDHCCELTETEEIRAEIIQLIDVGDMGPGLNGSKFLNFCLTLRSLKKFRLRDWRCYLPFDYQFYQSHHRWPCLKIFNNQGLVDPGSLHRFQNVNRVQGQDTIVILWQISYHDSRKLVSGGREVPWLIIRPRIDYAFQITIAGEYPGVRVFDTGLSDDGYQSLVEILK